MPTATGYDELIATWAAQALTGSDDVTVTWGGGLTTSAYDEVIVTWTSNTQRSGSDDVVVTWTTPQLALQKSDGAGGGALQRLGRSAGPGVPPDWLSPPI